MPLPERLRETLLRRLRQLDDVLKDPEAPKVNTTGLMKQLGALMVETSDRAFSEQRLGSFIWPERYPGQEPPKLNLAGTISDFNEGRRTPKPNRFQDRPALVDEGKRGGIWGSLSFEVLGPHEVEAGTNKPYARLHQEGGRTTITVTDQGYKAARRWLFTKEGFARKGRLDYAMKLEPILRKRRLSQRVIARPFVGFPERLQSDMIETIEDFFEREQRRLVIPGK